MNLYERLYSEWHKGKMITRIIMVNVFVFCVVNVLIGVAALFDTNWRDFFESVLAVPADPMKLLIKPWTIITSGFLHFGLFHILFNMLWLYWVGKILQEYIGSKKILPIYIYGVIAGALLMILSYNFFPVFADSKSVAIGYGASAGVLAIIWATVALLPDHRIGLLFFGAVPLIYIAGAITVLDLIYLIGGNAGGHIAHLGGALLGYWFIKSYQNGRDYSVAFNNVFDGFISLFQQRKKPRLRVKRGGKAKQKRGFKKNKNTSKSVPISEEARLNQILDKINEKGYSSLSEKEKAFLKEQSKT